MRLESVAEIRGRTDEGLDGGDGGSEREKNRSEKCGAGQGGGRVRLDDSQPCQVQVAVRTWR